MKPFLFHSDVPREASVAVPAGGPGTERRGDGRERRHGRTAVLLGLCGKPATLRSAPGGKPEFSNGRLYTGRRRLLQVRNAGRDRVDPPPALWKNAAPAEI